MKKFRITWKEIHSVDVWTDDLDVAIQDAMSGSDAVSQKYQTVERIELLEGQQESPVEK